MFWILNSENFASNPGFCTMRAYLCDARRESFSLVAPATTIVSDAKIRAVVLGSRTRMMMAANHCNTANTTVRLCQKKSRHGRIIFCIAGDGLEVETAVDVEGGDDTLDGGDVLLLEGEGGQVSGARRQWRAGMGQRHRSARWAGSEGALLLRLWLIWIIGW
ncbi:hypothetical protein B0H14DRAFT_2560814 [Mycena olivaceomarginata]|nr:hypothetical protein B0H14DRAFT_2560814 [Mycena olivaceomarginata]